MAPGDLARHRDTGFEGIVTARNQVLGRATRVELEPRTPDHAGFTARWFDEEDVELVERGVARFRRPMGVPAQV